MDGHGANKSKTLGPQHNERTVILESLFLSKDLKGEDLHYVGRGKHEVVEVDVSVLDFKALSTTPRPEKKQDERGHSAHKKNEERVRLFSFALKT